MTTMVKPFLPAPAVGATGGNVSGRAAVSGGWPPKLFRHLTCPHPQPLSNPIREGGVGLSPFEAERIGEFQLDAGTGCFRALIKIFIPGVNFLARR
jgi:hypothetical protein